VSDKGEVSADRGFGTKTNEELYTQKGVSVFVCHERA